MALAILLGGLFVVALVLWYLIPEDTDEWGDRIEIQDPELDYTDNHPNWEGP